MRHGRKDPWDKPWVAYAAIGGVVVVIVLALVYFVGGIGHGAARIVTRPKPCRAGHGHSAPGPATTTKQLQPPGATPW